MAFLTVYFDDSGTHKESNTAVASCYVSTVEQWKRFEKDWNFINKQERFGVFHMVDFAAGKKQFANWTDEKQKRILDRLCTIIKIRARMGFFIAVRKVDYDKAITGRFRDYCGRYHYSFAVRKCASFIGLWRKTYAPDSSMRYVFDRMGKGKQEIMNVMDIAKAKSKTESLSTGITVLDGYSFENKANILPLQAADILAWTSFQQMQRLAAKRKLGWIAEMAFEKLSNAPLKGYYYTKDNLLRWAQAEKDALAKRGVTGFT